LAVSIFYNSKTYSLFLGPAVVNVPVYLNIAKVEVGS
jgi:hypothetical protein